MYKLCIYIHCHCIYMNILIYIYIYIFTYIEICRSAYLGLEDGMLLSFCVLACLYNTKTCFWSLSLLLSKGKPTDFQRKNTPVDYCTSIVDDPGTCFKVHSLKLTASSHLKKCSPKGTNRIISLSISKKFLAVSGREGGFDLPWHPLEFRVYTNLNSESSFSRRSGANTMVKIVGGVQKHVTISTSLTISV